jgi:hypothetical protein
VNRNKDRAKARRGPQHGKARSVAPAPVVEGTLPWQAREILTAYRLDEKACTPSGGMPIAAAMLQSLSAMEGTEIEARDSLECLLEALTWLEKAANAAAAVPALEIIRMTFLGDPAEEAKIEENAAQGKPSDDGFNMIRATRRCIRIVGHHVAMLDSKRKGRGGGERVSGPNLQLAKRRTLRFVMRALHPKMNDSINWGLLGYLLESDPKPAAPKNDAELANAAGDYLAALLLALDIDKSSWATLKKNCRELAKDVFVNDGLPSQIIPT